MKEYFDRLYRKGFDQFIEEMGYSLENEKSALSLRQILKHL